MHATAGPGCVSGHTLTPVPGGGFLVYGGLRRSEKGVDECSRSVFHLGADGSWRDVACRVPPGGLEAPKVFAHSACVLRHRGEDVVAFHGGMLDTGALSVATTLLHLRSNRVEVTLAYACKASADVGSSSSGSPIRRGPLGRWGHTAVVHPLDAACSVLFGGHTEDGVSNDLFAVRLVAAAPSTSAHLACAYERLSDVWGDAPAARRRHASVVSAKRKGDECMYVFGGRDAAGAHFNDLHEFSFATTGWRRVEVASVPLSLPTKPCPRVGLSAVFVEETDTIVVFGGSVVQTSKDSGYSVLGDVYTGRLVAGGGGVCRGAADASKRSVVWERATEVSSSSSPSAGSPLSAGSPGSAGSPAGRRGGAARWLELPPRTMSCAILAPGASEGSAPRLLIHGGRDTTTSYGTLFEVPLPGSLFEQPAAAAAAAADTPQAWKRPSALASVDANTLRGHGGARKAPDSPFSSFAKSRMEIMRPVCSPPPPQKRRGGTQRGRAAVSFDVFDDFASVSPPAATAGVRSASPMLPLPEQLAL